jgi:hypothetical protein
MCKDPMCDKEIQQCEKLAQVLANANGRCNFHEDLVKGISDVGGMVKIILIVQAVLVLAIFTHMKVLG